MHERGDGLAYNPQKAAQYYIAAIETGGLDVTKLRGRVNGYTPYWDRQTALEFQRILQERGLYQKILGVYFRVTYLNTFLQHHMVLELFII